MITARDLRSAARAAREPGDVALTPDQADALAARLDRLERLAGTAESFVACVGRVTAGAPWSSDEVEGLGYLAAAVSRVRP